MDIVLVLISLSISIYLFHKIVGYIKSLKKEIYEKNDTINDINNKIINEIEDRSDKVYHQKLKNKVESRLGFLNTLSNKISKSNLEKVNNDLNKIDSVYVELKQNLRLMDNFENFQSSFSNKKRKYRTCFNKSLKTIDMMIDKYGNNIDKYLTKFNKEYSYYKENDIDKLNKMVKKANDLYEDFNVSELRILFKEICNIDDSLNIKLQEPNRLRDKFICSEDNIDQLGSDIENKRGSLYFKVFNIIKNNKVSKEDTDHWNKIKRMINSYKKSKLLKSDIIDLSERLNKIINELTELNDKIKSNTVSEKVN